VVCGESHTIVLTDDNVLHAVGKNHLGQLGCGYYSTNEELPKQVKLPTSEKVIMLKTGGGFGHAHSFLLNEAGILYSFGSGAHGQLGYGSTRHANLPTQVAFFEGKYVFDIACGWIHSLVVTQLNPDEYQPMEDTHVWDRHGLGDLEDDILWKILFCLDFKEISALSLCSLFLNNFTNHDYLWKQLFLEQFTVSEEQSSLLKNYFPNISWRNIFRGYYIENNSFEPILHNQFCDTTYNSSAFQEDVRTSASSRFFSGWMAPVFQVADWWRKKADPMVILCGLQGSGRTSILHTIRAGDPTKFTTMTPQYGELFETVHLENMKIICWTLTKSEEPPPQWCSFAQNCVAIVWVLDCGTKDHTIQGLSELVNTINKNRLTEKPLLLYANKQDKPNAIRPLIVARTVGLRPSIKKAATWEPWNNKIWCIQPCEATTGKGVMTGIHWLAHIIHKERT